MWRACASTTRRHYIIRVRRLESRYDDAKRITDDTVYRIWRLYMAGCGHAFAKGRVSIYQVLFSKPNHGNAGLPLTRADWYG
jgi:cyclopropane-fatty-acyl-phospholipid synthase